MKRLKNGNYSIGSPNSPARIKAEYEQEIEKINNYWFHEGFTYDDVIDYLRDKDITDPTITELIIENTFFKKS